MIDLLMKETDDGGDFVLEGNDLLLDSNFGTMIYQALFGGYEYWANDLLLEGSQKYESKTEKTLKEVALNSAGRVTIENAVREDLKFFTSEIPGTTVSVSAQVISDDKMNIQILINNEAYILQFVLPGSLIFIRRDV
ncbi:MAG: hypothetical protein BGO31_00145 [Bacteroidetes bacterium 43-16]|uniref:hypothetical protein n=1 Tax=uncultured Dysgonomonas sp. TaxID=206096 RepID=UPI00092A2EA1|nr:hypothetical protein [uncultured Dysgonomonas sp.]OJV51649.1 MAG: hypothetical protein BGO31_00145 [Bacteroidetes bacterium 43-16]